MTNRETALTFLQHCFAGHMEAALALLAEDATWWVMGDPEKIKLTGTRDMARIKRYLAFVSRAYPNGIEVEFTGVTAEGERVAVEAVSSATMGDGRPYGNSYHFLVQVRNERVVGVREYLDTQYVHEMEQSSQQAGQSS